MGKVEIKKQHKYETLLATAYQLFTTKGIAATSIADIAQKANVAKGTFYLYFKDKADIRNRILIKQAEKILDAVEAAQAKSEPLDLNDRVFFLIDATADAFLHSGMFLRFTVKNLSWDLFQDALQTVFSSERFRLSERFETMLRDAGKTADSPALLLFLLTEMAGGAIYSAVAHHYPADYAEIRPYLRDSVAALLNAHLKDSAGNTEGSL